MKRISSSCFVLAVALTLMCSAQVSGVRVKVTNPAAVSRGDQTVSVPWSEITRLINKEVNSVTVTDEKAKKEVVSQLFDGDMDGKPDELLFQSDFAGGETKVFTITASAQPAKGGTSFVDARYVEPRQDLAWENDRIAFRMYGPALAAEVNNGIDVWTKRVRYLIVRKWYEGEEQTPKIVYHIDHGEGADFFNVGRSLGCGGSGIWRNNKVYQPGVFNSFKILATGPIRACFELTYDKWDVDGIRMNETKRITLDAGHNLNRIDAKFSGPVDQTSLEIACGLVKRDKTKMYLDKTSGWMSLWGQVNDSLPNGYLGTGVVLDAKTVSESTEDSVQYLLTGRSKVGSVFTYYAGAGWTRSGDFGNVDDWNKYLAKEAQLLKKPLKITVSAVR